MPADLLEADDAIDLGIDRVILANANIVANPKLGSALPDNNCAGANQLAIVSLDAQSLGLAVAAVARAADAFLCAMTYGPS